MLNRNGKIQSTKKNYDVHKRGSFPISRFIFSEG